MRDGGGPRGDEVGVVCLAEGEIFHLFDIGSGCEGFFAACEDNGTDGVVIVVFLQGVVEFAEEGGGEGIECSRAVEGDC